jgi:hypothetical protein
MAVSCCLHRCSRCHRTKHEARQNTTTLRPARCIKGYRVETSRPQPGQTLNSCMSLSFLPRRRAAARGHVPAHVPAHVTVGCRRLAVAIAAAAGAPPEDPRCVPGVEQALRADAKLFHGSLLRKPPAASRDVLRIGFREQLFWRPTQSGRRPKVNSPLRTSPHTRAAAFPLPAGGERAVRPGA